MDKFTKVRRYPHLLPKEVVLWSKFLDLHEQEFLSFDYDVHVGVGAEIPEIADPMIRRLAQALTRKRIDVVGYKSNNITLFEIKPDAGVSAIGQLLSYFYLFRASVKPKRVVQTHIISDIIDRDTRSCAKAYGVNWTTIDIDWTLYIYDRARRKFFLK